MPCAHENFVANVAVARLKHDESGPATGFSAEVKITCTQCNTPFRFIGVAAGNHYAEPRVSIDGTELRAPIEPAEHDVFAARASYTMPPRVKQ